MSKFEPRRIRGSKNLRVNISPILKNVQRFDLIHFTKLLQVQNKCNNPLFMDMPSWNRINYQLKDDMRNYILFYRIISQYVIRKSYRTKEHAKGGNFLVVKTHAKRNCSIKLIMSWNLFIFTAHPYTGSRILIVRNIKEQENPSASKKKKSLNVIAQHKIRQW